jgi:hypothetical protein
LILNAAGIVSPDPGLKLQSMEAMREYRLDSLTQRQELCDKRIDILIIASFVNGVEEYLAIENKISSKESDDQTINYTHALTEKTNEARGRILRFSGILLSPYSCVPQSCSFYPVGYSDLFKIVLNTKAHANLNAAKKYADLYLFELLSTVMRNQWIVNKSL